MFTFTVIVYKLEREAVNHRPPFSTPSPHGSTMCNYGNRAPGRKAQAMPKQTAAPNIHMAAKWCGSMLIDNIIGAAQDSTQKCLLYQQIPEASQRCAPTGPFAHNKVMS